MRREGGEVEQDLILGEAHGAQRHDGFWVWLRCRLCAPLCRRRPWLRDRVVEVGVLRTGSEHTHVLVQTRNALGESERTLGVVEVVEAGMEVHDGGDGVLGRRRGFRVEEEGGRRLQEDRKHCSEITSISFAELPSEQVVLIAHDDAIDSVSRKRFRLSIVFENAAGSSQEREEGREEEKREKRMERCSSSGLV